MAARRRLGCALALLALGFALVCDEAGGLVAGPRPRSSALPLCDVLQRFLENRNATEEAVDESPSGPEEVAESEVVQPNTICGGRCCDREMEEHLRQQAKEDFHNQIHHHSRSLLGLLATTADALRGKSM